MMWLKQFFKRWSAKRSCIASISIDSVLKMEQKNYPQVYLEECKCRVKKKKILESIDPELRSESESDSE